MLDRRPNDTRPVVDIVFPYAALQDMKVTSGWAWDLP